MVGRLVQKKYIGGAVDQLAQAHFRLFSSAENSDLTFDVFCSETAFCQSGPYLVLGIRREFFPYLFDSCGGDSLFCFLFKVAYFQEIPLRD